MQKNAKKYLVIQKKVLPLQRNSRKSFSNRISQAYINDKTKDMCRDADILTAGSYIINSDNFQEKISSLR